MEFLMRMHSLGEVDNCLRFLAAFYCAQGDIVADILYLVHQSRFFGAEPYGLQEVSREIGETERWGMRQSPEGQEMQGEVVGIETALRSSRLLVSSPMMVVGAFLVDAPRKASLDVKLANLVDHWQSQLE
jgi:hypothetical protein